MTPIAVALTAEFCPARLRGTATIIVCCGFPVGAGGGGFIVAQMLPAFGWQSAFLLGGTVPLAHASGLAVPDAVRAASLTQVGSILGTLTLAALVRRFDTFTTIGLGYLSGVAMLVLLAFAGASVGYFTVLAFLAGFFVIGFQTGANAVSGLVYPDRLRSTGVGWALGVGRVGAIVGPSLGGVLIGLGWPTRNLFIATAAPAVIAALSAFVVSQMLRRSADVRDAGAVPTAA
jgi:AAHS family 4-hydroxybenzoate transporter-like MFS transporter